MNNPILGYVVGAAFIGLFIGAFVGSIARGVRARRVQQRLNQLLADSEKKLADVNLAVTKAALPAPRTLRWTGTEVAAVVAAAATFVGSVGAVYANYNGHQVKELQAQLEQSKGRVHDIEVKNLEMVRKVQSLLAAGLQEWLRLPETPSTFPPTQARRPLEYPIDNRRLRGNCNTRQIVLTFRPSGPSVLHCDAGSALIRFNAPTRLLIAAETAK